MCFIAIFFKLFYSWVLDVLPKLCPAVPNKSHASASSDSTTSAIGTQVTYTCDAGYYFNHVTSSRTVSITCEASGGWSTLSEECTGQCRCCCQRTEPDKYASRNSSIMVLSARHSIPTVL